MLQSRVSTAEHAGEVDDDPMQAEMTALLCRVQAGCQASFGALYRRTSARLFAIVLGINRHAGEAEDVLQEVYVKAWRRRDQFDPAKGQALHWLTAIARHTAISSLRSRAPLYAGDDADDRIAAQPSADLGPDEAAVCGRAAQAVRASLHRLALPERECVMLAFYNGLTHQEVAHRVGKPLGTVKSWMRRSLVSLRPVLGDHR